MTQHKQINNQNLVIYQSEDGQLSFHVEIFDETVWLTQEQIGSLFGKARNTITEHIRNIFTEGELREEETCRNFRHVTEHGAIKGKERNIYVKYYNLDVIISVGYRVKSQRGIQFRRWATKVLKQHLINGYSVNEVRIKQIESSLEELVAADKIKTKEIGEIKELLKNLIARPIIIHNHNKVSVGSDELERKLIALLDEMMAQIKDDETAKMQLEKIKHDLSHLPDDSKAKNRLMHFFKEIGDDKSEIHKTIKGAGIAKNIISDLIRLGGKLRDLL